MINSAKITKARKTHKCCLCGGDIQPKEKYYADTWFPSMMLEDSAFYQYKAHIKCHEFLWSDFDYWYDRAEGFIPPYEIGDHKEFIERMGKSK